jgi:predicted nucleic acid-binding Zn ribbon protein
MNDEEAQYLSQIPPAQASRLQVPRLGSVLQRVIQRRGYAAVQSTELLADAWRQAAGEGLARQTRIGKLERGSLVIFAANPTVRTELEFMKSQLVRSLQSQLPDYGIRGLRIKSDAS